jgi:hypothetical protein
MIFIEIPVRTIKDQIDALASGPDPTVESLAFVAGALAALSWIGDPKANEPPIAILLREYCAPQGVLN